jgi:hypothetical protein
MEAAPRGTEPAYSTSEHLLGHERSIAFDFDGIRLAVPSRLLSVPAASPVFGFGPPQVVEYFLRGGEFLKSFNKVSILRRSLSASIGSLRADGYRLVLSRDLEAAANAILPMLD